MSKKSSHLEHQAHLLETHPTQTRTQMQTLQVLQTSEWGSALGSELGPEVGVIPGRPRTQLGVDRDRG